MFEQIQANRRRSAILVIVMAILLLAMGWLLAEALQPGAGPFGLLVAIVVWGMLTLIAHASGDRIFLAVAGAHKIQKEDLPVLWNVVEEMTIASGLPRMPDIYVIDDDAPNAFATGRSPERASVAVTGGLLRICNRDELQGVIAHELGHVQNRDILLMLYAGVLVGSIALLAEIGLRSFWFGGGRRSRRSSSGGGGQLQLVIIIVALVLMILAPLMARLLYLAISRRREFLADATSAVLTRYPEGLASALEKISASPVKMHRTSRVTAPMYIINPMRRAGAVAADLTATHPSTAERVRILRAMAGGSFAEYERRYREARGGKGLLPRSARNLEQEYRQRLAARAAVTEPAAEAPGEQVAPAQAQTPRERARAVDDLLYRQRGYRTARCECGATLKVPPQLLPTVLKCPRCGREHALPAPPS
jgi:heat shock protein HtpX